MAEGGTARNHAVAHVLEEIADLLELQDEQPFRVRAYRAAAEQVRGLAVDIAELDAAGQLDAIPGVGKALAAKIHEYLTTGQLGYLERLRAQVPAEAVALLRVPGIGPARARQLIKRGITSLAALRAAAERGELRGIPGFGAALEQQVLAALATPEERPARLLLGAVLPLAEALAAELAQYRAVRAVSPVGSLRRWRATVGDVTLLVATAEPDAVIAALPNLPGVERVRAEDAWQVLEHAAGVPVRVVLVEPDAWGTALLFWTGARAHVEQLAARAVARGWRLTPAGLVDERGRRRAGADEAEVYAALGLDWVPPELREGAGEVEAAAAHALPTLVTVADIRGELHAHTDWSDGADTLEQMVEAARARGDAYLVITDHSPTPAVAGGLSAERLREQHRAIAALNAKLAPFRVLHGAEVSILPDGRLDYPDDVLAMLDVVIVSVHNQFRQSREAMTARICRALAHPMVDVLGHATGRLLGRRDGYAVDLEAVIATAAAHGVAIEVNGQPDRLDIEDVWVRRAIAQGVLVACTTDAHSCRNFDYRRYAVAQARRGWAEARHVLNARDLDGLLAWRAARRAARQQG